jgi:hypothetical protein
VPDLGQKQETIIKAGATMISYLWVGEAIVAVAPVKAWITGRLPFADTTEEGLKRSVYSLYHVLQDLGIDLSIFRHRFFDTRQLCFLLKVAHRDAAFVPGFSPFPHGCVVDAAAQHQHTLKFPLLRGSGLKFVLECLAYRLLFHGSLFCLIGAKAAIIGSFVAHASHPAFIPIAKARAPQPEFSLTLSLEDSSLREEQGAPIR